MALDLALDLAMAVLLWMPLRLLGVVQLLPHVLNQQLEAGTA